MVSFPQSLFETRPLPRRAVTTFYLHAFSVEHVNGQAFGGGILLAVGAALWAVYFLPIWTKRRQFSAAQENALRIQRTLRMLAETSDVPSEVRVEATAKQVLAHERLLQASERSKHAEQQAKIAAVRLAEKQSILEAKAAQRQAQSVRRELIRRSRFVKVLRIIAAFLGALSVVGLIAGIALAIVGFGVTTLGVSAAAMLVSLMSLVSMAPRRSTQMLSARDAATRQPSALSGQSEQLFSERAQNPGQPSQFRQHVSATRRTITESRSERQPDVSNDDDVIQAKTLLEIARRKAEEIQREEARKSHELSDPNSVNDVAWHTVATRKVAQRAPVRPGAPQLQTSSTQDMKSHRNEVSSDHTPNHSSLSSMGVVEHVSDELPNLDQVLMRRRAAS